MIDIIRRLEEYHTNICYMRSLDQPGRSKACKLPDPKNYGEKFDAVILAVSHNIFKELDMRQFSQRSAVI